MNTAVKLSPFSAIEPRVAVDIPTLFNVTIPAAFTRDPSGSADAVQYRYQFTITGVGAWSVDGTVPSCKPGTIVGADVTTLSMTAAQFQDLCVMPRKKILSLVPEVWSGDMGPERRFPIASLLGLAGIT
jgi:hypothetical protein